MEPLKIKVKYHDDGVGEPLKKLEKIEIGDWIDLRASKDIDLEKFESACIPLGVSMQLPTDYEAHIVPRSSTFKKWGIIQTNHMGIIDNSYSGDDDEWMMPVLAFEKTHISKNDRICQFRIVERMPNVWFEEVEHLDSANRGGFGSTGKK